MLTASESKTSSPALDATASILIVSSVFGYFLWISVI